MAAFGQYLHKVRIQNVTGSECVGPTRDKNLEHAYG